MTHSKTIGYHVVVKISETSNFIERYQPKTWIVKPAKFRVRQWQNSRFMGLFINTAPSRVLIGTRYEVLTRIITTFVFCCLLVCYLCPPICGTHYPYLWFRSSRHDAKPQVIQYQHIHFISVFIKWLRNMEPKAKEMAI